MTPDDFRRAGLSLPDVIEGDHMNHPDFGVDKKVFATLDYRDVQWGMAKLGPDQQAMLLAADPATFRPVAGAWGRKGSTQVCLAMLDQVTAMSAIGMARRNVGSP